VALLWATLYFTPNWYSQFASLVVLILFFIFTVGVAIGSEVVAYLHDQESRRIEAIELSTRSKFGSQLNAPSDTYYYQSQKLAPSKYSVFTILLFLSAVAASLVVSFILVVMIALTLV